MSLQIQFRVTQKTCVSLEIDAEVAAAQLSIASWRCTAVYLVYYATVAASLVSIVVHAALGYMTVWRGVLNAAAFGWATMVCLMMWPPVSTLLPREETEQGWRVR
jgi:hypothetical protein